MEKRLQEDNPLQDKGFGNECGEETPRKNFTTEEERAQRKERTRLIDFSFFAGFAPLREFFNLRGSGLPVSHFPERHLADGAT